MVAISYFFYKLMLVDFSVMFYVYSVYTEVDQQKFVEKIRNGDHVFIPIYYVLHEV
jgi:hypothetical protein